MLLFLQRLTKHNELIAILCSGLNLWNIIIPPVIISCIFGILFISIVNPIAALGMHKSELLKSKIKNQNIQDTIISRSSLLFVEQYGNNTQIIRTKSIDIANKELHNVTILNISSDDHLERRIDATTAILNHNINLQNVKILTDRGAEFAKELVIPTKITIDSLLKSFSSPETVPIWYLPKLIKNFVAVGIPVAHYQIYYYKQLFKPILMVSAVIFAACFFTLNQRDGSHSMILTKGVFFSIVVYLLLEILIRILSYSTMTPVLAVFLPSLLMLLLSNLTILRSYES